MAKRAGERDAASRFEEIAEDEHAPPARFGRVGKMSRTLSAARASGSLLGPPIWHARRIPLPEARRGGDGLRLEYDADRTKRRRSTGTASRLNRTRAAAFRLHWPYAHKIKPGNGLCSKAASGIVTAPLVLHPSHAAQEAGVALTLGRTLPRVFPGCLVSSVSIDRLHL
jgi:hypothetical protein